MSKKGKRVLVTGGAGFIGSEFVRQAVGDDFQIFVVDCLTYAGDLARLKSVRGQFRFFKVNICNKAKLHEVFRTVKPDQVVHFAAETHVDRSLQNIEPFLKTNILGTQNVTELCLKFRVKKFLYVSTDEVYGPSRKGRFQETDLLKPANPYAATKAAAEMLVSSAVHTFNLPAIIVRPSNCYGKFQDLEKFIPVIIFNALKHKKIPVYGRGKQVREWLHVEDCVKGILSVLSKGKLCEVYNLGSGFDLENIQTVKTILKTLNKSSTLIKFVQDRQGHDFRYSVDSCKIKILGWKPKVKFADGIKDTVNFYL